MRCCGDCLCRVSIRAAAQAAPPASTAQGLQLLHRMQDALGGAERIAAIRDFEETVDARTWNPDGTPLGHVRKRTRWMRDPNVIRLDQVGPRDTYVLFYDGSASSGWEILPDRGGSDPLRSTSGFRQSSSGVNLPTSCPTSLGPRVASGFLASVSTHAHRRSATSSDRTVSLHAPARPSRDAHRRADPG